MTARPYSIRYRGTDHMVTAPTAAQALAHVTRGDVERCEPAKAIEVVQWMKAGHDIAVFDPKASFAASSGEAPLDGTDLLDKPCQGTDPRLEELTEKGKEQVEAVVGSDNEPTKE